MMITLFEDEGAKALYPASIGRAAFAISCGGYRLIDLLAELGHPLRGIVRPHLRTIVAADNGNLRDVATSAAGDQLLLNASVVPSAASRATIESVLCKKKPGIIQVGNRVAAALLPEGVSLPAGALDPEELTEFLETIDVEPLDGELELFEYPHDIVRHHLATIRSNLEDRIARGQYEEVADGVFAAVGAELGPYTTTDTRDGPIILEADAKIGPYSFISGPAYIGPAARVIEHSAIKDGVSLGHTTKIGGEIEATIVEPYTNKQHHGFLGHSYLGSWINLGAGTCNSDLKNTYGQVNMEYDGRRVPTGMQFIGAIVGDYAKTAINTGIFTGRTIGACSMLYGFVTTNVPSFVNYARSFGQVTETPVEVLIATQARMFARRDVEQRACDIQLLRDMYELTRHERQMAGEPLTL